MDWWTNWYTMYATAAMVIITLVACFIPTSVRFSGWIAFSPVLACVAFWIIKGIWIAFSSRC